METPSGDPVTVETVNEDDEPEIRYGPRTTRASEILRPRRAPSAAYSHQYEREFADILCTMDKELTQTYERADGPMG